MSDLRFLHIYKTKSEIEQMYKDNDIIQKNDIVLQEDNNDDSLKLFINGKWVTTTYISKISDNTKVENDIQLLNSSLNDVSSRLFNDYVTNETYLNDEKLISNTFADIKLKVDNLIPNNNDIPNIKKNVNTINSSVLNIETTLNNLTGTSSDSVNNVIDNFKEVEKFLSNISDSSTLSEILLSQKEEILASDKLENYYVKSVIDDLSTNVSNIDASVSDISVNINDISNRLDLTIQSLTNYVTKDDYVSDEKLIANTLTDMNSKIQALQEQVKKLLATDTTDSSIENNSEETTK